MQAGLHLRVYKQRVKKFLSKEEFRDPDACLAVTPSMQVTECEKKCTKNSDLDADKHEHAEGWLWHARPRCPGFTRHSTRPCYHQVLDVCDAALFHNSCLFTLVYMFSLLRQSGFCRKEWERTDSQNGSTSKAFYDALKVTNFLEVYVV